MLLKGWLKVPVVVWIAGAKLIWLPAAESASPPNDLICEATSGQASNRRNMLLLQHRVRHQQIAEDHGSNVQAVPYPQGERRSMKVDFASLQQADIGHGASGSSNETGTWSRLALATASAMRSRLSLSSSGWDTVTQTTFFFAGCFICAAGCVFTLFLKMWSRVHGLRRTVEKGLRSLSRDTLGTDITVGLVSADIWQGRLLITDLTIANPAGYKSKYLLHADRAVLDIDLVRLAWHGERHLFINNGNISDVDVIVEKARRSSNLLEVMSHLAAVEKEESRRDRDTKERSTSDFWEKTEQKARSASDTIAATDDSTSHQAVLRKAVASNIRVELLGKRLQPQESVRFVINEIEHGESADQVGSVHQACEVEWEALGRSIMLTLLEEVSKETARREAASSSGSCATGMLRAALNAAAPPPRKPQ